MPISAQDLIDIFCRLGDRSHKLSCSPSPTSASSSTATSTASSSPALASRPSPCSLIDFDLIKWRVSNTDVAGYSIVHNRQDHVPASVFQLLERLCASLWPVLWHLCKQVVQLGTCWNGRFARVDDTDTEVRRPSLRLAET